MTPSGSLSEDDISVKFITPALHHAGWDEDTQIRQTMVNDFRPFGQTMAKLSTAANTIERSDGTTVELPRAPPD